MEGAHCCNLEAVVSSHLTDKEKKEDYQRMGKVLVDYYVLLSATAIRGNWQGLPCYMELNVRHDKNTK